MLGDKLASGIIEDRIFDSSGVKDESNPLVSEVKKKISKSRTPWTKHSDKKAVYVIFVKRNANLTTPDGGILARSGKAIYVGESSVLKERLDAHFRSGTNDSDIWAKICGDFFGERTRGKRDEILKLMNKILVVGFYETGNLDRFPFENKMKQEFRPIY